MANQSHNSQDPNFCANNCGFFGNPSTHNLCSKCYKEYIVTQSKDLGDSVLSVNKKLVDEKVENNKDELARQVTDTIVGGSGSCSESRAANRCSLCKKRVGLTGFKCRCDQTFCSVHRYSDKHNCVFDYKGAGQDAIASANPVVKAAKIEKI